MNQTNNNKVLSRNRRLALTGAFSALIIVLSLTNLGMIPLGTLASITILQIPVILAVILAGLPSGLFVGTVFGIFSLILAATRPSGSLDPLFVNPLCSVLPRILFAAATWFIWKALNYIPKVPKFIFAAITGFTSTMLHTLFVIGCLYLFKGGVVMEKFGQIGYWAFIGMLTPQALMEAAAATIVCSAVFLGLFIVNSRKSKFSEIGNE